MPGSQNPSQSLSHTLGLPWVYLHPAAVHPCLRIQQRNDEHDMESMCPSGTARSKLLIQAWEAWEDSIFHHLSILMHTIAYITPKATNLSHQPFPHGGFGKVMTCMPQAFSTPLWFDVPEGEPFESMPLGFIHRDRLKMTKMAEALRHVNLTWKQDLIKTHLLLNSFDRTANEMVATTAW